MYLSLYIKAVSHKDKEQVNIRLAENMVKLIDKAIGKGLANDRSEFIRMAIVERLRSLGVVEKD